MADRMLDVDRSLVVTEIGKGEGTETEAVRNRPTFQGPLIAGVEWEASNNEEDNQENEDEEDGIEEVDTRGPPKSHFEAQSHEDLKPIPVHLRTWRYWNFASMWFAMAICIPTYMLGASLLSLGLNWWQSTLAVLVGTLVTLVPLVLNGFVGTKYGISFPVYLRSCFGTRGAKAAAVVRGLVAIGWFSFQVWVGALALYSIFQRFPAVVAHDVWLGDWMGITLGKLLCFIAFLLLHVLFVWLGMDSLKWIQVVSAPILTVGLLLLFAWAWYSVGLVNALDATNDFAVAVDTHRNFPSRFVVGVCAVIGSWATLALNDLDFTRFARRQLDPIVGQGIVFPLAMTFCSFVGIVVTGAAQLLYNAPFWDPAGLFAQWSSAPVAIFANLVLVISVIAINLTANMVSPANDFANLWPEVISYRMGGYITCIVGVAIIPWKLFADSNSFIFVWLIGYSPLLGAICGIMLVDFWIVQRRCLVLDQLFVEDPTSIYWFKAGWNVEAIIAWIAGPLPCIPGFLVAVGAIDHLPEALRAIYDYSWFVAIAISSLVYLLLTYRPRSLQHCQCSTCTVEPPTEVL